MALKVKKQERETSQTLLRRFTRAIQKSGILLQARSIRFKKRPKSREAQKRVALRREELKKEYERLEKLGKPEE